MLEVLLAAALLDQAVPRPAQACNLTYERSLSEAEDGTDGILRFQIIGERCAEAFILIEAFDTEGRRILETAFEPGRPFHDADVSPEDAATRLADLVAFSRNQTGRTIANYRPADETGATLSLCLEDWDDPLITRARRYGGPTIEIFLGEASFAFWYDPDRERYFNPGMVCGG
ncbi:hypothetical protein NHF45_07420 [Maricaulaceae bacterium NA33B04]|nr:hypothetical protein [Maricaulaceae bacterium NA33B04]